MERVKVRQAIIVGTATLRINDGLLDRQPSRVLDNTRIAVGPINAGSGEQAHAAYPDVDLQAIAVVFYFMHPRRTTWRPLGYGRQTRGYEG